MQSTATETKLSHSDLQQLLAEPSVLARTAITQKICNNFNAGNFSAAEIELALEIFRLLLRDSEIRVRQILAQQLSGNSQVPHDIIWQLAQDRSEIATFVLQDSFVLREEDLLAIVRATRELPKLLAIAGRDKLSKSLAHALAETRDLHVTKAIINNNSTNLADSTLALVMEVFAKNNSVLEALVQRGGLPYEFAENLFSMIAGNLKKQLTKRYKINPQLLADSDLATRETAILQFLSPWMNLQEIQKLVEHMHKNGRLNGSLILRSLCIGDLRFFEASIAKLVGIPAANVRVLLLDTGPLGFKALYESARLPEHFYQAAKHVLQFALQETEHGKYRANNFNQIMRDKIIAAGYDQTVPHMPILLGMLGAIN
jgi:uncharacterized protein (DUF2336 family)